MYNYGQYYNYNAYQNNYDNQYVNNTEPYAHQTEQPKNRASENDKFPSVILHVESNKNVNPIYESSKNRECPPLPTSHFKVVDKGCASPRFVRSTYHIFPSTTDLAKKLTIPLGLIVQPCAYMFPEEDLPPAIDISTKEAIPKCQNCKSYSNPFIKYHNGGCKFLCPLCLIANDVPQEDVSPLDYMGQPLNIAERPDLQFGSYEYKIKPSHCQGNRFARAPVFVFMLDVSYLNVNNGLVDFFCTNLKTCVLSLLPRKGKSESYVQVAFVTYDTKITLYTYSNELNRPKMVVLTDVDDICLPMSTENFLLRPFEAEKQIDSILALIKSENRNNAVSESVLGPVINLGVDMISSLRGCGRLFVFHSTLPSAKAPGSLHIRGGSNMSNKKPSDLLTPQTKYYDKLGERCCKEACSVELFLFPNSFCDVVTLSSLCNKTGGKLFKYDSFQIKTDGLRFLRDLQMNVSAANQCFDCSFTLKTCLELREVDMYGSFTKSECTGIRDAAIIDQYSSFGIELSLYDNLPESGFLFLQFAMVYTDVCGERLIRIHNVAYSASSVTKNVMNVMDCFAVAMLLCKKSLNLSFSKTFQDVETWLVKSIGTALAHFSKDGASNISSSLNLPTCIQILPVLTLGFLKIQCFMQDSFDYDEISLCHSFLLSASVDVIIPYFYPSIYDLHDEQFSSLETVDFLIKNGALKPISCDCVKLCKNKSYLIDSGFRQILLIGDEVGEDWLINVLGKRSIAEYEGSVVHKVTV